MKNTYDSLPQPSGKMSAGDLVEGSPNEEAQETPEVESQETGVNSVHLSDHCFADAKDGEDVLGKVEGTVVHEQGGRFLVVHKIDGYPVAGVSGDQAIEEETPEEPAPADLGEAASDMLSQSKRMTG